MIPAIVKNDILMSDYTTYKVGGPARYFAEPSTLEEIKELLNWVQSEKLPLWILGKGSNLVVSDKGFDGLILWLGPKKWGEIQIEGQWVKAQSGALLHTVVSETVKKGLQGVENLGGIPGTMGGGAYINAGAFGQELTQVISKVTSICRSGEIKVRSNAECQFAYRHSLFFDLDEIILEVDLKLQSADPLSLKDQMTEILKRRKEKQPLEYPNAGSMYKRPPGTYAGKLIEEAGLKGFRLGGAAISPKHANFVINKNQATAQDIYDLSEEVALRVKAHSGISLEKEQIFVGSFEPWPR